MNIEKLFNKKFFFLKVNINLVLRIITFLELLNNIYSSKYKNEYITDYIEYNKEMTAVKAILIYSEPEQFYIKNYDIEKIREYKKITLINNITFIGQICDDNIFNYRLYDSNQDRFNISLIDLKFYDYSNEYRKRTKKNLIDFGFRMSNISEPFSFYLINNKTNKIYYIFDKRNFLFTDTLIMFDSLMKTKNIYGFGERNYDFNLDIGKYTIWPNDTGFTYRDELNGGYNLMGHQPIGLHRTINNKYIGLLFLNYNAQDLIINKTNKYNKIFNNEIYKYYLRHITIGGVINYYITYGDTVDQSIKLIHKIIGTPTIPPFWGLGWHQCRWGYETTKDLLYILDNYTKYNIPLDGLWTDLDLMENKKSFYISSLHKNTYKFVMLLHLKNKHFIPLLDFGFSYDFIDPYFLQGLKTKAFIKSNYTKDSLISYVWGGKTVFPDFFTEEGQNLWILGLYNFNLNINFDGLWLDMNEPAMIQIGDYGTGEYLSNKTLAKNSSLNIYLDIPYIPGFRKGHDSISSKSISVNAYSSLNKKEKKNFYTMYNTKPILARFQNELTNKFITIFKNKRPFIFSRGNTVGQGKYGFHWLGDNRSNFKYLKWSIANIFNYNIFGIPFVGADICGFHNDTTDELCARWHILGALYPFSRNHNVDTALDQEPWSFFDTKRYHNLYINDKKRPKYGGYTLRIARKAIKLRYSLLKYYYTQLFLISLNLKSSLFKPAFFEFSEDKILINNKNIQNTHVMIGSSLYFIPNLNLERDDYLGYFPNENFNCFQDGSNFINYKNDRINGTYKYLKGDYFSINLFIRGGSILPIQNISKVLSTYDLRYKNINLIINPNTNLKANGDLIYDYDDINVINTYNYFYIKMYFDTNKIDFIILNTCPKKKNYSDDIIGDIIILRESEINLNKTKYENAIINLIDGSIDTKKINYKNNKMLIKNILYPIYLFDNIIFK